MNLKLVYAIAAVVIGVAVYMLVGRSGPTPPPPGRDANHDPLPPWAVARLGRFVAAPVRTPFVVSADGKTVTAAIGDGEVGTVSIETGEVLTRTRVHEPSPGTVFVVDGRIIPSLTRDWSSSNNTPTKILAISPDGTRVAIGRDGGFDILEVATGSVVRKLEVDRAQVGDFTVDGSRVVMTRSLPPRPPRLNRGGEVRIMDIATGAVDVAIPHPYPFRAALAPDGKRIAIDGACFLYASAETGEDILRTKTFGITRPGVTFAPDGTAFARFEQADSKSEPILVLHDAGTGAERWRVPIGKRTHGIAISPDGTRVAVGGRSLRLLDAADGRLVRTIPTGGWFLGGLAFSTDGRSLISTARDRLVSFDTATGEPSGTVHPPLDPPGAGVASLAWSDDSKRIATGGFDGAIHVWNAASGKLLETVRELGTPVGQLRFRGGVPTDEEAPKPASLTGYRSVVVSRDGTLFATVGPGRKVIVRDAATDAVRDPAKPITANHVTFSACNGFLAAHDGGPIRVHDIVSGAVKFEIMAFGGSSDIPLAVSTGGKLVAWAGQTSVVELWSVGRDRLCTRFVGHSGNIQGLSFSPDGTRLASRSADGTVLIWDVSAFR